MAFLDSMKGKITNAGQSTAQKAKDLSGIAKLNAAVAEAEREISDLYGQIGYEVYRAYRDWPVPEAAELIEQVTQLHQRIADCKEQIKAINAANSCPQCGAKIVKGNAFCGSCGYKFPEPPADQVLFCGSCGAHVAAGASFCTVCGAKII